jgi:hypothetical protein
MVLIRAKNLSRQNNAALRLGAAVALILCLSAAAAGQAQPATRPSSIDSMRSQVATLEAKVASLQTRQEVSQADISKAVDAILADADAHSAGIYAQQYPSGYDPATGFIVQSADGNFSLHPDLMGQFRYQTAYRLHVPPGGGGAAGGTGDDTKTGFELARLRLSFDGDFVSPLLTYYFQMADDNSAGAGGAVSLLDAYVMWRVSAQSPLALKAGQFKDPVWHEANLLPSRLMAVDRSLVNAFLGGGQDDRVEGAAVVYDQSDLRGQLLFHNGYNSANNPFFARGGLGAEVGAGAGLAPTNWGTSGRAELLALGQRQPEFDPFSEYDQFTAMGDKQDILVLGSGFDYSESQADKILFYTADAQFNTTNGWSLYAAYLAAYRNLYTNHGAGHGSFNDSGFLVQAAYMVGPRLEPFARYDYTHLDGKALPGIPNLNINEITIGANYYLYGQRAKFTLDASWLPNGSPADVNFLGVLQDDRQEFLLRAQFQFEI